MQTRISSASTTPYCLRWTTEGGHRRVCTRTTLLPHTLKAGLQPAPPLLYKACPGSHSCPLSALRLFVTRFGNYAEPVSVYPHF